MIEARIAGLYIGDEELDQMEFELDGIMGDKHRGFTKLSDVRDKPLQKKIPVQNYRQWSGISVEETQIYAETLGCPAIDPRLLLANIAFTGVPDFTKLQPGTKLNFSSGTILKVESDNEPCIIPGRRIAEVHPQVQPSAFVKAAWGLRGLVGTVFLAGIINTGDVVTVEPFKPKTYSLP